MTSAGATTNIIMPARGAARSKGALWVETEILPQDRVRITARGEKGEDLGRLDVWSGGTLAVAIRMVRGPEEIETVLKVRKSEGAAPEVVFETQAGRMTIADGSCPATPLTLGSWATGPVVGYARGIGGAGKRDGR